MSLFPSPHILSLGHKRPQISADAFIASGAVIVGDVHVEAHANIWFNCVLRGDAAPIRVGRGTSIQDGTIVHADPGYPTHIADDALIGHLAMIHGCTIGRGSFVGMGATVLTDAVVEPEAMLAAGAMLTGGKIARTGQLWAGRPAKYLRDLQDADMAEMRHGVAHYRDNAALYRVELSVCTSG